MSVVIPYTFVGGVGNKARAAEVNANFAALANKFTTGSGGIDNSDIKTGANIDASTKILALSITPAQLAAACVTATKLAADATAGSPNAAIASANNFVDAIIPASKLVAATVAKDRLKVLYVETPFVGGTNGQTTPVAWFTADVSFGTVAVATYEILYLNLRDVVVTGGSGIVRLASGIAPRQVLPNWLFNAAVTCAFATVPTSVTATACGLFLQKT